MSIDYIKAKELTEEYLNNIIFEGSIPVRVVDALTIEYNFGWVLYYESQEFLETRDFQYILIGKSPIIVDKEDGSVHKTYNQQSIEAYVELYKECKNSGEDFDDKAKALPPYVNMTYEDARALIMEHVCTIYRCDSCIIQDELTIEESFGWIFFYECEFDVQIRDTEVSKKGRCIIERDTGTTLTLGEKPIERYIELYKQYKATGEFSDELTS